MAIRSIPKRFHRIWFGGPMPDDFAAYGETWLRHHPGWRMDTWNEENLPRLRNQRLFDQAATPAEKADIARYELLSRFGGVYLDTDFECLRNIEELLPGVDVFAATEDGQWINCAIIGSVAGHPLMERMIEEIAQITVRHPDLPINERTGPKRLTAVVEDLVLNGTLVTVFPAKWFYPYHFSEKPDPEASFPDAYAVHHWAQSWVRT